MIRWQRTGIVGVIAASSILVGAGEAYADAVEPIYRESLRTLSLILACVIASVHMFGEAIHARLFRREKLARSFGSGMAVAYMFLQLVPELQSAAARYGHRIHLVVLGGFLGFYGLAKLARAESGADVEHEGSRRARMLPVHMVFMALYSWVIVYSVPELVELYGVLASVVVCAALAMHLLASDHGLAHHYGGHFRLRHRILLAAAALLAGTMDYAIAPNPLIAAIAVALVTGFLMFGTLNEEIPEPERSNYPMFLAGALTVTGLLELAKHI